MVKKLTYGLQKVIVESPIGERLDQPSINWADPTTWYPQSKRVTEQVCTPLAANQWNMPHKQIVDLSHGKVTQEDRISEQYQVNVYADGQPLVEEPLYVTGPFDYKLDYETGVITMMSDQAGKTITADYNYQDGSAFLVQPIEGKILRIDSVEVQFSDDIDLRDTIVFQPSMWNEDRTAYFPVGVPTVYKTMYDYINEASLSYPTIPQIGGTSWRGMRGPVHIFKWPYKERATTDLAYKSRLLIEVKLKNNVAFGGDFAVATFYSKSVGEG